MPKTAVLLMASITPWSTASQTKPLEPATLHHHLKLDSRMYGSWKLDTVHSRFAGSVASPLSGSVNWTVSGWSFALAFSNGGIYTDAAYTDDGCFLIGVSAPWNCSVEVVSPTHVHLVVREGSRIDRSSDIELIDGNTERAVHRVTPSHAKAYLETTLWKRE